MFGFKRKKSATSGEPTPSSTVELAPLPSAETVALSSGAEVLAAIQPWLAEHRRPAWKPIVTEGEPTNSISKFGGMSWLQANENSQVCVECGKELQLFVQLALSELPPEAGQFGDGVVQLFYCGGRDTSCIGEGGWEAFSSGVSVVRIVPKDTLVEHRDEAGSPPRFPARSITGWSAFDDVPSAEEIDSLGLLRKFDRPTRTSAFTCESIGLEMTVPDGEDDVIFDIFSPECNDKLGGWPAWVQGPEYPSCPTCGSTMRLMFQVASEDNVPYMFGDVGIGHITQCPTHLDVVAFGWACG